LQLKTYKGILFLILLAGLIFSCNDETDKTDLENLLWLEGEWVDEENNYYESWIFLNSSFQGKGLTIDGNDTIFEESLLIKKENGSIYYYAQIDEQNEGKTIPFRLKNDDSLDLIFENKKHDFPNIIRYKLINESELRIRVSDTDSSRKFELIMKK